MELHDRPGYPRWLAVLLTFMLIALVAVFAYNLGVTQGVAHSGAVVAAPAAPGGAVAPIYIYPRHWGWGWGPGFGFAPFLGLFWVFLMFAVIRRVFWGPRWYRRGYGCYGGYYDRVPPDLDEWHRRAHGQQPPSATTTQL